MSPEGGVPPMMSSESPPRAVADCPSVDVLRAFSVGKLVEEELHRIAAHLEHCTQCSSVLLSLPGTGDSLIESLHKVRPAVSPVEATRGWREPGPGHHDTVNEHEVVSAPMPERVGRYVLRRCL